MKTKNVKPRQPRPDYAWRPGLDINKAGTADLVAEVARITAAIVPRLSIEHAAAMLASIDAAIVKTPPISDAADERQRFYGNADRLELFARRVRQLELWSQ